MRSFAIELPGKNINLIITAACSKAFKYLIYAWITPKSSVFEIFRACLLKTVGEMCKSKYNIWIV